MVIMVRRMVQGIAMVMATIMPMNEDSELADLVAPILMTWLSPAFPVGGFAFSHGLEWAFEAGYLSNRADLQAWLEALLKHGSGRNDAVFLKAAWVAGNHQDNSVTGHPLADVIALSAAMQPSSERNLEATVQGGAFHKAICASWPHPALLALPEPLASKLTYPVAIGMAAAAHGLPLAATLSAFLQAFTANLVSASVRLGIVGQTDGQRVMAALLPVMILVTNEASQSCLDDLGGSCLRADMASLHHETQYSRLFRS
jgi:urease accessory protein